MMELSEIHEFLFSCLLLLYLDVPVDCVSQFSKAELMITFVCFVQNTVLLFL